MAIHELKINPLYYSYVESGIKTFEIRKNDRDFKIGDVLHLKEYTKNCYSGNEILCEITYILKDINGLESGYSILGIEVFKS